MRDSFFEEPVLAQASKKRIDFDELPQVVQNNFHDTKYSAWQINRILEEKEDDQTITYEIVISSENSEEAIRFDELGNTIINEH